MNLRKRVERLETGNSGGEVTLTELVLWSYRDEPSRRDDPEYVAFKRRCEGSLICKLIREAVEGRK